MRFAAASIVLLLLGSVMAYQFAASQSASKISQLEDIIREKESELDRLTAHEAPVSTSDSGSVNCIFCHDPIQTKGFHTPPTIMQIGEKTGTRRRVCIDCHGPNAYDEEGTFLGWSAENQMTPLSMISFDETAGLNGVFVFPNTRTAALRLGSYRLRGLPLNSRK
jgi:hypothetical protein